MSTWNIRPDKDITRLLITDEFGWGSHTACGETCNAAMLANSLNGTPSYHLGNAICARDRVHNLTDSAVLDSQTTLQLASDLYDFEGFDSTHAAVYGYKTYYTTDDVATISRSLIGHVGGILIEVHFAYKLPFMESGVNNHFIFAGAYDDSHADTHFLVLNPDRVPRLTSPYHGDWMSIQTLANAGIIGMIKVVIA